MKYQVESFYSYINIVEAESEQEALEKVREDDLENYAYLYKRLQYSVEESK